MKITRQDDFGGAVLNCAIRYCLGRQSYMPGLVMDEILMMLPDCNDKTIRVFIQDVEEWLDRDSRMTEKMNETWLKDVYRKDWERFIIACRKELCDRGVQE